MKGDSTTISNFQFPISNSGKGQSLIEVVIGVGVAVMLAISLITTSLITQRTARSARNNTQATKLAQGYIEEIRAYRDRKGFSALSAPGDCITIVKSYTPPASPTSEQIDPAGWSLSAPNCIAPVGELNTLNGVNFYRYLKFEDDISVSPVVKKTITVTVKWNETSGDKIVTSQTILTKWEGLP